MFYASPSDQYGHAPIDVILKHVETHRMLRDPIFRDIGNITQVVQHA